MYSIFLCGYSSLRSKDMRYPSDRKQIVEALKSTKIKTKIETKKLITKLTLKNENTFNHFLNILN